MISTTPSNTVARRQIVIFAAASLIAVASGAATLALSGVPMGSWIRNPIAWAVGLAFGAGVMLLGRSLTLARAILAVSAVAIAATFLAPAQQGVHRWIDAGPLHVNVAAVLLPAAIVALAFCGIWSRTGVAFAATISALLVLQPDASQATSFLVGVVILLARSGGAMTRRVLVIAIAVAVAAVSWTRPDPLQPVPEVEGIFRLALDVSPALVALAALALAAASLAPLTRRGANDAPSADAALALAGYFVSAAMCPAFGAFPVPLVGLGMSFPVGYWLGIALLCADARSTPTARADGAMAR